MLVKGQGETDVSVKLGPSSCLKGTSLDAEIRTGGVQELTNLGSKFVAQKFVEDPKRFKEQHRNIVPCMI